MMGADAVRCMRRSSGGGGGDFNPLDDDFILVVDTTLPGADNTVQLSYLNAHDIIIDWGDGVIEPYSTSSNGTFYRSHTYAISGEYIIRVSGTITRFGYGTFDNRREWKRCEAVGTLTNNLRDIMLNARNLQAMPTEIPSGVIDLRSALDMGYNTLDSVFNSDISNWDVSSVTIMDYMLRGTVSFDQDITSWCVSNILTEPVGFSLQSGLSSQNKPVWGTCP